MKISLKLIYAQNLWLSYIILKGKTLLYCKTKLFRLVVLGSYDESYFGRPDFQTFFSDKVQTLHVKICEKYNNRKMPQNINEASLHTSLFGPFKHGYSKAIISERRITLNTDIYTKYKIFTILCLQEFCQEIPLFLSQVVMGTNLIIC